MAADDIAAVVITPATDRRGTGVHERQGAAAGGGRSFRGTQACSPPPSTGWTSSSSRARRRSPEGASPRTVFAPIRGRDLDPSDLERAHNVRRSMETLENVARGLGAARGRRKAILYFSEGIDYETLDVMRRVQRDASAVLYSIRDAIATATRNGVAVYPVDPRGLISGLGPDDIQMKAPVTPRAASSRGLRISRSRPRPLLAPASTPCRSTARCVARWTACTRWPWRPAASPS